MHLPFFRSNVILYQQYYTQLAGALLHWTGKQEKMLLHTHWQILENLWKQTKKLEDFTWNN